MLATEKSVFAFARCRQRVEADEGIIHEAGVTHDDTILRQPIEKLPHQTAEIVQSREIVDAGESGIEYDVGARCSPLELRAQGVENQCLGRAQPLG